MTTAIPAGAEPRIREISIQDIDDALKAGWADYRRAPLYGLAFSAVYVLAGIGLWVLFTYTNHLWWIVPFATGFPLIAPFAAVGLYEVSRRLERGAKLAPREIFGVIWSHRGGQLPYMALVVFFIFMAWVLIAYGVFASFYGTRPMTNVSTSLTFLASLRGVMMLSVGAVAGAVLAGLLFMLSVVSLPMLLDREVDLVTALQASVRAVWDNPRPMASWAGLIAGLIIIGMLPAFLGLFLVLPVLGHASWHVYRKLVD